MKNLVKSISLVALLFSASFALAQQPQMQNKTPQERAQSQTQMMQKNLGLADDQKDKVYAIILKYAQQIDAARSAGGSGNPREAMQAINANREAELKGVLTADQFQKFQAEQQARKEKMQERKNGGMNGGN